MSRGLGIEQRNILLAAAKRPHEHWQRMALQQEAWGIRRPEYKLMVPEGRGTTHPWVKNVKWWRDGKALTEGNFTRALQSLERRGLLISRSINGGHTTWRITPKGLEVVNGRPAADSEHSEHLWLAEG